MEKIFIFLGEQWTVAAALLACIAMLLFHESRRAGKTVTAQEAVNMINQQQAVLVDLRDAADFRKGHVVDALNIPYAKFAEQKSSLEKHKDKPIILACKLGQHSSPAGKALSADGFKTVFRLSGGMTEWQNSRLPVVKS